MPIHIVIKLAENIKATNNIQGTPIRLLSDFLAETLARGEWHVIFKVMKVKNLQTRLL